MRTARLPLLPPRHIFFLTASILAIAFVYILLLSSGNELHKQLFSNFLQIVPSFFGGLYTLLNYRNRTEPLAIQRRGWTLIGAAAFSFGLGQCVWTYDESYLKIEVPFPSLADAGWLASSAFFIVGVFMLFGRMRIGGRTRIALDIAIAAGSLMVLIWYLLIGHVWTLSHDPEFSKILGVIYPVFDAIILSAAFILVNNTKGDKALRARIGVLCLGIVALLLADIAFNIFTLNNTFKTGNWPDAAWICGWLFIWYACLPRPCKNSLKEEEENGFVDEEPIDDETGGEEPAEDEAAEYNAFHIAVPYIAVIASFVAVIALDFSKNQGKISAAVYGIGWVLLVLIIVRQVFTLLENQHTLQRNHELNRQLQTFNDNLELIVDQRTAQLTALHGLAHAANDSLEIESVLEAAEEHIPMAISGDGLAICVFEKLERDAEPVVQHSRFTWHDQPGMTQDHTTSILSRPFPRGAKVLRLSADSTDAENEDIVLCLRAPLCWRHHVLGIIGVVRINKGFEPGEFELIESIGLAVGTALQNARQFAAVLQAEQDLKNSLAEKEVLLKEIHHRVKNNMQVISSLLNMQASHISDARVKTLFQESQNRIRSMALVHERLYRSTDLAHVDFGEYLTDITANLVRSYHGAGVELQTMIDDVELDLDTAIPCGLIVNELVSNSLKHAFVDIAGRKPGENLILVTLCNGENGNTELSVCDNGIGFPASLDFRNTDSLGLQLVTTLTTQIGGKVELAAADNSDSGTRWILTLPKATRVPETSEADKPSPNAA